LSFFYPYAADPTRIFAMILSLFTPPYLAGITATPNEAAIGGFASPATKL